MALFSSLVPVGTAKGACDGEIYMAGSPVLLYVQRVNMDRDTSLQIINGQQRFDYQPNQVLKILFMGFDAQQLSSTKLVHKWSCVFYFSTIYSASGHRNEGAI